MVLNLVTEQLVVCIQFLSKVTPSKKEAICNLIIANAALVNINVGLENKLN